MLLITFVYSSPLSVSLLSAMSPNSREIIFLMLAIDTFWPNAFALKNKYRLCKSGWYVHKASLSGFCCKCCKYNV